MLLLAACGGAAPSSRPADPIAEPPPGDPPPTARSRAELACQHVQTLQTGGCDFVQGIDTTTCVAELQDAADDPTFAAVTACFAAGTSCRQTEACIEAAFAEGPDLTAQCARDGFGPVYVPRAEWNRRHGATARTFADAPSSKERPIEVCQIANELVWLTQVTCADGSNPFRDRQHAHEHRVGNVGPGGQCDSIIDLYRVPCPEQTYEVYMDAYLCPAD